MVSVVCFLFQYFCCLDSCFPSSQKHKSTVTRFLSENGPRPDGYSRPACKRVYRCPGRQSPTDAIRAVPHPIESTMIWMRFYALPVFGENDYSSVQEKREKRAKSKEPRGSVHTQLQGKAVNTQRKGNEGRESRRKRRSGEAGKRSSGRAEKKKRARGQNGGKGGLDCLDCFSVDRHRFAFLHKLKTVGACNYGPTALTGQHKQTAPSRLFGL